MSVTTDPSPTPVMPRKIGSHVNLKGLILDVMSENGLTTRDVVKGIDLRHIGTVYRLLAGRTTDPWASTLVSLCRALKADPDRLLGAENALDLLDPELRLTFEQVDRMSEEDKWLALDMIRSVLNRRLHGLRGPKSSATNSQAPRRSKLSRS